MLFDFDLFTEQEIALSYNNQFRCGIASLLIFYRGAWSKTCRDYIMSFVAQRYEFEKIGTRILFISTDSPKASRKLKEENGICYPLLSDPEHRVADVYDVAISRRHPRAKTYSDGFIQPAIFYHRKEKSIFHWISKPEMWNLWGSRRRPRADSILERVYKDLKKDQESCTPLPSLMSGT